jgi:hypothetical protein
MNATMREKSTGRLLWECFMRLLWESLSKKTSKMRLKKPLFCYFDPEQV